MKVKENIKREILITVVKDIFVVLILIFLTFFLVMFLLNKNHNKTYTVGDLAVELDEKINVKLDNLYDKEGLLLDGNRITITNNGDSSNYRLLVCDIDYSDGIRVGIDKSFIRTLSNQLVEDNCYIIFEGSINKETSYIHTVRFWYRFDYDGLKENNKKWYLKVENKD